MSELQANIFSIQRFSTEDGPGIRTTIFFKGCPMRCPWCHNPEALHAKPDLVWHSGRCIGHGDCIRVCPQDALTMDWAGISIDREKCKGCAKCVDACPSNALELHGRTQSVDEIFETVMRDADFYSTSGGGVTLSGGEPLAQPRPAIELLRRLRGAGVHTALDTCGAVGETIFREALEWTDLLLLDIKTVDPEKHERFTGVPFDPVRRSARAAREAGVPVWVRTPIIPGYTDDEEGMRAVARFVAAELPDCQRHELLAFSNLCGAKYEQLNRPFALDGAPLLREETLECLRRAAVEAGSVQASWSGPTRAEGVQQR